MLPISLQQLFDVGSNGKRRRRSRRKTWMRNEKRRRRKRISSRQWTVLGVFHEFELMFEQQKRDA